MAEEVKKMGWSARMRDYFGFPPGGGAVEFAKELKAIKQEDRQWFCDEFNKLGMPTENPQAPKAS